MIPTPAAPALAVGPVAIPDETDAMPGYFPFRRRLPNGRIALVHFEGTESQVDAWIAPHEAVLQEGE